MLAAWDAMCSKGSLLYAFANIRGLKAFLRLACRVSVGVPQVTAFTLRHLVDKALTAAGVGEPSAYVSMPFRSMRFVSFCACSIAG